MVIVIFFDLKLSIVFCGMQLTAVFLKGSAFEEFLHSLSYNKIKIKFNLRDSRSNWIY